MHLKTIVVSAAIVMSGLSGCASLNESYRREVQASISPAAATLVVARAQGSPLEPPVIVNGSEQCRLDDNTYCIVQVKPGPATISSTGFFRSGGGGFKTLSTQVILTAGQVTYVKIDSSIKGALPVPLPLIGGLFVAASFGIAEVPESEFIRMRSYVKRSL